MNRLYVMLNLLTKQGYDKMVSCDNGELFKIKEYMTFLNENEDVEGDLKEIILSPKDIFIGMFKDGIFYKFFQVIV